MHHVIAASKNPAKIKAIVEGFEQIYGPGTCQVEGVEVDSGVPEQPLSCDQTRQGARNRVIHARRLKPKADFWVAIEAGIDDGSTFSWVIIENSKQTGEARSATLPLPAPILTRIRQGEALGPAMSAWSGIEMIGCKEGAIGAFTAGKLTRTCVYVQAVILALSPFHNAIYRDSSSRESQA